MKYVYNTNYMLEVLKHNKKVYPKSKMYEAIMLLVKARKHGLLDIWKMQIRNCENEELKATEAYLNKEFGL